MDLHVPDYFTKEDHAMHTLLRLIIAALVLGLLGGCIYANVQTPYDLDLDRTVLGQKQGRSSAQSVLWLVAWGDGGTAAAAKDGGITTVNHMDREVLSVLFGLYMRTTTIVYGN